MQEFVEGEEMPGPDDQLPDVLDGIGLATWTEFHRGLKSGSVKQYPDHYLIRGDGGPREVPLTVSNEELGRAILQALGAPKRYWRQ